MGRRSVGGGCVVSEQAARVAQALHQFDRHEVASEVESQYAMNGRMPKAEASAAWPAPPDRAAYHGLAGSIVRAVEPYTEADPVAILGTLLATFGAVAGNGRTLYQGSRQAPNIYAVLAGDTGTGRKGTAWGIVQAVFDTVRPGWESILVPGLASGEGLIGHLKRHEGVEERALVLETELGRLLSVMAREGSTLSPTLRDAWDGVPLGRFLSREGSLVTRHHVGCLAHITPVDLRAKLTDTDAANGFGNRFLWIAVRRRRLVPFPTSPVSHIGPFVAALNHALDHAGTRRDMEFTSEARDRWEAFYAALPQRHGLTGALLARAEAQVARLALVYALLDRQDAIGAEHLDAAEALWSYAERSARYLFGDSTGNRDADYIRRLLADGPFTKVDLRHETGIRDGARLQAAIDVLVEQGIGQVRKGEAGPKGGPRPQIVELVPSVSLVPGVPAHA